MNDDFALTGTYQREPEPIRLVAGPLAAELVNGNLRTVRFDGTEVLRAIGYIVRDRDWGTYEPAITNFRLDQDDDRFSLGYDAECAGSDGARLRYSARIAGSAEQLTFTATATPEGDFETNRCGFCILHPIVGLAGSPVSIEHTDGTVVETVLPELVDPWQPFKDMRAITHTVRPGLTAQCRMEGDTFEMEDQRNWSDASYKTYVRPLALPWPYVLPAGKPQTQTVTLRFSGRVAAVPAPRQDSTHRPALGETGPPLSEIGVVVYPGDVPATADHLDRLKELAPQALLLHFDPTAGHGAAAIEAFARLCRAYLAKVTLEFAVPCKENLDVEMAGLAALVRDASLTLDCLVVSPSVDRRSTPPGSKWPDCPPLEDVYAAARRAFPGLRLGGGMLSYFTELNRKRVPPAQLDFITHCTCPIVHASDDLSVMQSLAALEPITRSVRSIYEDKPYRIGPSTIAMRQNP
jgi:D-apionolactonase